MCLMDAIYRLRFLMYCRPSSIVRCLALCLALVLFPAASEAQTVRLGLKGGLTLSTFQGDTNVLVDNASFSSLRRRASYQAGAFAMIRLNEWLDLRPEAYYVQKGAVLEGETLGVPKVTGTYRFPYIQIPILVELRIPTEGVVTPSVFLGPVASFSTTSGVEVELPNETRTRNFEDVTSTLDFGAAAGVGLRYRVGDSTMLTLDARYNPGLSDIISEQGVDMRTDSILLSLGYAFSL